MRGGCIHYSAHKPAKTSVSPRSSPLGTFSEEERLRLSDRNSILMTQINVYIINVTWVTILGDPGADSGDEGKSKRAEKYMWNEEK